MRSVKCLFGFHSWKTVGRERGDYRTKLDRIPMDDYSARVQKCRREECNAERRVM